MNIKQKPTKPTYDKEGNIYYHGQYCQCLICDPEQKTELQWVEKNCNKVRRIFSDDEAHLEWCDKKILELKKKEQGSQIILWKWEEENE